VGEEKGEAGPEVVVVGGQRRADNVSSLALPLSPVPYIADVLGLVDIFNIDDMTDEDPPSRKAYFKAPRPSTFNYAAARLGTAS